MDFLNNYIAKIKQVFTKLKDTLYPKYWTDPVWSKVISAAIIALVGFISVWIKSLYDEVSFISVAKRVVDYLKLKTEVNNFVLWILVFAFFAAVYSFLKGIINKIKASKVVTEEAENPKELPTITEHSTVFFLHRLTNAFPGQRGLIWYDAKTAVQRLKILFKEPLKFKSEGHFGCMTDPIWWFRNGSDAFIDKFKVLSRTKVLIGHDELELKRIAVFISRTRSKSFIYVEAKGEKQTGLYDYKPEDIKKHIEAFGYSSEEYGLLGNTAIRREEYDDGATTIKGKVVDATSADLRLRYLSDYNFIIVAKQSPYNSRKFRSESVNYFNDILIGKQTPEIFFDFLSTFEDHEDLY